MLHLLTVFDEEQKEVKKKDWHKTLLFLLVIISISISGFLIYTQFYAKTGMAVINQEILKPVIKETGEENNEAPELKARIIYLENELTDLKSMYQNEILGILNKCSVESIDGGAKTSCNEICYGIGPRKTCVNSFIEGKPVDCSSQQEGKLLCTCCKAD